MLDKRTTVAVVVGQPRLGGAPADVYGSEVKLDTDVDVVADVTERRLVLVSTNAPLVIVIEILN